MGHDEFRKRQISQWEFAPEGAFRLFTKVETGLSKATCEFVFYRRDDNSLVTDDASEEIKQFLEKYQWAIQP